MKTLGELDLSQIQRLILTRRAGRGGTRTMKNLADIRNFIRNHSGDAVAVVDGKVQSVKPGADYVAFIVTLKSPANLPSE